MLQKLHFLLIVHSLFLNTLFKIKVAITPEQKHLEIYNGHHSLHL